MSTSFSPLGLATAQNLPSRGGKVRFIGHVHDPAEQGGAMTEVTVDSAAEESVCPKDWGSQFGLQPVAPDDQIAFVNASGGRIIHYGSRKVVVAAVDGQHLGMTFQVTDVKKPLLAVSRLLEHGNIVKFGPLLGDSFVQNVATGSKLMLERRGNSWVISGSLAASAGF